METNTRKKITITIKEETMLWLKAKAKDRNITVTQLAEELFNRFVDELKAKERLRKVS